MDKQITKNNNFVNHVGIAVSVLVGVISVYAQLKNPQEGLLLFLVLVGAVFLYFLISWPVEYFMKKMRRIEHNTKIIGEIKKDLNSLKDKLDIAELKIKVSSLEQQMVMKNKRGQIDPRWVLIVIILILLFLFLKAKGII